MVQYTESTIRYADDADSDQRAKAPEFVAHGDDPASQLECTGGHSLALSNAPRGHPGRCPDVCTSRSNGQFTRHASQPQILTTLHTIEYNATRAAH